MARMGRADALHHRALDEALRLANIPGDLWERKGAGLGAAERAFHRAILRAFPELGGPPGPARLRAAAAALGLEPEAALAALHDRDLIRRDPATGTIACAYPFSGPPMPHRVAPAGGRAFYAMCAVDVLGIPFLLGRDATITSADPTSREPVRVAVCA